MLTKSIPLVLMAAGAAANKDKIEKLMDGPKVAATQMEVSSMAKILSIDSIDGVRPDPNNFAAFVRGALKNPNEESKRDVAFDMWGQPYKIKYDGNKAIIYSMGPDKLDGTADDVRARVTLL